jgi:hypothetical protein
VVLQQRQQQVGTAAAGYDYSADFVDLKQTKN